MWTNSTFTHPSSALPQSFPPPRRVDWASQERGGGTADRANQKEFEEAKVSILKWQIWTIATVKILKRDEALQRFTHKFTDTHCHLADTPLLAFALSVMLFSYSGLLGVYFTELYTKRGSETSVTAALITGFIITLLFQPYIQTLYLPPELTFDLAFTWKLCIATFISTLVCLLGKRNLVDESCRTSNTNKIEVHA